MARIVKNQEEKEMAHFLWSAWGNWVVPAIVTSSNRQNEGEGATYARRSQEKGIVIVSNHCIILNTVDTRTSGNTKKSCPRFTEKVL